MRLGRTAGGLLVALAFLVAGCGGGGGSNSAFKSTGGDPPAGASFVPADALGFLSANSDFGGDQWKQLGALADKFPAKDKLLAKLEAQLAKQGIDFENDVKPALGPETDAGFLNVKTPNGRFVVVTQPSDPSKTEALEAKLAKNDPTRNQHEVIDGWYVASDAASGVAAAKSAHAGTSLADSDTFKTAMGDLSQDALLKFFVDGPRVTKALTSGNSKLKAVTVLGNLESLAGDVVATGDGLGLHVVERGTDTPFGETYSAKLPDEVPAGVLLYLSFNHLDQTLKRILSSSSLQQYTGLLQATLGISIDDIAALFAGEGALYVRPGTLIPEVTLVVEQADEQKAESTLDKLVAALTLASGSKSQQPQKVDVDGVSATKVAVGSNFALYYAVFDGKLVVTDSTTGISGLKDSGPKLSSDQGFKDAKSAASMPDQTGGFLYVDLKDAIPAIENIAQVAGQSLPTDVISNLTPLRSFLIYTAKDGDKLSADGFLTID